MQPQYAPLTPLGAQTPHAHPAYAWAIAVLAGIVTIGGYLALANTNSWWPYSAEPAVTFLPPADRPVEDEFTPAESVSPSTSPWSLFNSQYFTLSFMVPPGFTVLDTQDRIAVAYGPYKTSDIGSDNAFLRVIRYGPQYDKKDAMLQFELSNRDVQTSSVTVDGYQFVRMDGVDTGSYEGSSAGRTFAVFFDKSSLHVEEYPGTKRLPFDTIAMAEQILSTFRFSR